MNLSELWSSLSQVKKLNLNALSLQPAWSGEAEGLVDVSNVGDDVLIFSESGEWNSGNKPVIKFFNIYRWRFVSDAILELAHLRNGMDSPVHLLDFKKAGDSEWHSKKPHLCREDIYNAVLLVEKDSILLNWTVEGPEKKQTVKCLYQ